MLREIVRLEEKLSARVEDNLFSYSKHNILGKFGRAETFEKAFESLDRAQSSQSFSNGKGENEQEVFLLELLTSKDQELELGVEYVEYSHEIKAVENNDSKQDVDCECLAKVMNSSTNPGKYEFDFIEMPQHAVSSRILLCYKNIS